MAGRFFLARNPHFLPPRSPVESVECLIMQCRGGAKCSARGGDLSFFKFLLFTAGGDHVPVTTTTTPPQTVSFLRLLLRYYFDLDAYYLFNCVHRRRPLWCKRPLLVLLNSSINQENRCGTSELDARENCRNTCAHSGDCG